MKLQNVKLLLSALLLASFFATAPTGLAADSSGTSTEQSSGIGGPVVDHIGSGLGSVKSVAEELGKALDENASGGQIDALVDALSKVHFKSDKAAQVAQLGKIKGVAGFLSNAVKVLRYGEAGGKLISAVQNRDRAAFQQVVADTLTGAAADFIAGKLSGLLYKHGTTSLIAGLATGGSSLILAGVEFGAGFLIDQFGGKLIKDVLQKSFVQDLLLKLGGKIYDVIVGTEDEPAPDRGPLDDEPDPNSDTDPTPGSTSKGRFQGLKPIKIL